MLFCIFVSNSLKTSSTLENILKNLFLTSSSNEQTKANFFEEIT